MSRLSQFSCERLKDRIYGHAFLSSSTGRKELVSAQRLRSLINRDVVGEVLACLCINCADQRETTVAVSSFQLGDWVTSSGQLIFALLAFNDCAQLVQGFAKKDFNDAVVHKHVRSLTADSVPRTFWPSFDEMNPGRSRRLAGQVERYRYNFFVPTLNDRIAGVGDIQEFDDDAILPFASQELIGARLPNGRIVEQGGFGKVYGFQMLEEYKDFQNTNRSIPLVRKEVDFFSQRGFPEELSILLHVKDLEDKNVVRLVTAYKHGNKVNYVFPRAKTNLQQFLRVQSTITHLPTCSIEQHPLWEQTLGVLRAVYRIHNDVHHTTSGKQIKLYHFDLKPANILVDISEDQMSLLVADFGFSRLQVAATHAVASSKVSGYGGTPAYAPPEREKSDNRWNHRFDVWSLGCILLEITAFIVDGHEDVARLDHARYTKEPCRGPQCEDDYFWHPTASGKVEIKPTVIEWMNELLESANVGSKLTVEFLGAIGNLVTEMLAVDITERLDADAAQNKLSAILRTRGRQDGSIAKLTLSPSEDSDDTSVLVGPDELDSIMLINCKYGQWFDNVQLRLREDFLSILRLELWTESSKLHSIELGARNKVLLIPSPTIDENADNRIIILRAENRDPRLKAVTIYLSKLHATATLQSVLSGQTVRSFDKTARRSLPVVSVRIKKHSGGFRGFLGSDSKTPVSSDIWGRSYAIQLWSERSYKDADAWQRLKPRRGSPRFTFEVPRRRVVVYCEKALIIIRFGKNVRLEKPDSKYAGLSHRIVPTDQRLSSRDRSFELAVLESNGRDPKTVPLDSTQLAAREDQAAFECSYLEIDFVNRRDWEEFQRKYRIMKKEWTDEDTTMQHEKKYGAEGRGWAPEHGY